MPDPYVREVGSVTDMDDRPVKVGVDHDTVTIDDHALTRDQAEEFAHLFAAACWDAGENSGRMREETQWTDAGAQTDG
jgi:hypothetical protein